MIKRGNILARTLHKWIGLFVGIQVLIWLATGLYMVIVDLDFIHGDPLVKNMQQTIVVPVSSPLSIAALRSEYPGASHISLRPVMQGNLDPALLRAPVAVIEEAVKLAVNNPQCNTPSL